MKIWAKFFIDSNVSNKVDYSASKPNSHTNWPKHYLSARQNTNYNCFLIFLLKKLRNKCDGLSCIKFFTCSSNIWYSSSFSWVITVAIRFNVVQFWLSAFFWVFLSFKFIICGSLDIYRIWYLTNLLKLSSPMESSVQDLNSCFNSKVEGTGIVNV